MQLKLLSTAGPSRGSSRGVATPGSATFGGPAVGQKYKVRQNVPFWKEKFTKISRLGPRENVWGPARMFPRPRCGCRRAWSTAHMHQRRIVSLSIFFQIPAVFELPGVLGVEPPTVFSTRLTHCQIMYCWGSAVYYIGLYTIYTTILVGLWPSKCSTPRIIFLTLNSGTFK